MKGRHSSDSYDVAVVGSGPSGSTSALYLARQGVRVVVIEKASLPRCKACGGGIVQRAMGWLPVDASEVIERECHVAEVNLAPAHLHLVSKRDKPIVFMTLRERFDYLLVSAAKEAGAHIRASCKVQDVITHTDRVELTTSDGPVFAQFVVAADGAGSLLAKRAGWQDTRNLVPALDCEVYVDDGVQERFNHAARFDYGLVPSGYAWTFPKKDHLSMGVLSMRPSPIGLHRALERYLEMVGLDKNVRMKRRAFFIPVSPRKDGFVRQRVILTGDAAGLADPLTGEGISFAVLSGLMAAKALLGGSLEEGRVKASYESSLSQSILKELGWARMLANLIYTYPQVLIGLFKFYGQQFTEAVTDVVMGEKTYGKLLSSPMNYLELVRVWLRKHKEKYIQGCRGAHTK